MRNKEIVKQKKPKNKMKEWKKTSGNCRTEKTRAFKNLHLIFQKLSYFQTAATCDNIFDVVFHKFIFVNCEKNLFHVENEFFRIWTLVLSKCAINHSRPNPWRKPHLSKTFIWFFRKCAKLIKIYQKRASYHEIFLIFPSNIL